MSRRFLHTGFLPDFFELLLYYGEVHGPVVTDDGVVAFRPVDSLADLHLDYRRTLIPPKKYLLPPEDHFLTFDPGNGYTTPSAPSKEKILFGLHSCDLSGIAYLDRVFLSHVPDSSYRSRRQNLTLIGISCEPDPQCFCGDMGTDRPSGFDLFLGEVEDGFFIRSGSDKGKAILARGRDLLSDRHPPRRGVMKPKGRSLQSMVGTDAFPPSPLWEQFADRCLSCGSCSACCPTCYCYYVQERGLLVSDVAVRVRKWDNCLFKTHGEVAGGHNFRGTRLERLQYRFLHKFRGFGPERGIPSCVGCGRCGAICPVGIDLLHIIRDPGTVKGDMP